MIFDKPDNRLRENEMGAKAPEGPTTSWTEIFETTWNSVGRNDLTLSARGSVEDAYDERIDEIFRATGQRLQNPFRLVQPSPQRAKPDFQIGDDWRKTALTNFDRQVRELVEKYPDKMTVIRDKPAPFARAAEMRRTAEEKMNAAWDRAGDGWGKYVPYLAASFGRGMLDPVNMASMLVGGGPTKLGAREVAKSALKAGVSNMAVEAMAQPFVQGGRKEAGLDYGLGQAAMNIASAGVLGAAVDGAGRGLSRSAAKALGFKFELNDAGEVVKYGRQVKLEAKGLLPVQDANGNIIAYRPPRTEDEIAASGRIMTEAAKELPPDSLEHRAWVKNDPQAIREILGEQQLEDNPALRGALTELEMSQERFTRIAETQEEAAEAHKVAQAARALFDIREPLPTPTEIVPKATMPEMHDEAALPDMPGKQFAISDKPVHFRDVDLKRTEVDPEAFQFKGGGDVSGVTDRLRSVQRWDPMAAGRGVMFERADGTLVVADSHQRRGLAMRLADQETVIPAFVFREADGWTVADVRALAAKKNLQEGSGSVTDMATVIRERPDIMDDSMPLGSEKMRQARSLARLSDEAFAAVKGGVVPPHYAAMVGDLVPDRSRHLSMVEELSAAAPANAREARLMVGEMMRLPVHAEVQMTLLGVNTVERSLMAERVKVLDGALQTLKTDSRVFGLLTREEGRIREAGNKLAGDENARRAAEAEKVSEVLERLAMQAGPVSSWLSEAAAAVAEGQPAKRAADAFARRVQAALEEGGLASLTRGPEPILSRPGIDDPYGPEAKARLQALEESLKDDIDAIKNPEKAAKQEAQAEPEKIDPFAPDFKPTFDDGQKPSRASVPAIVTPAPAKAAIDDFKSSVSDLKKRFGIETRKLDEDKRSGVQDAEVVGNPQGLLFSLPSTLAKRVSVIKRGSRLQVIVDEVQGFTEGVADIVSAVERQQSIDIASVSRSDLTELRNALDEMAQIIENRSQAGYALSEQVREAQEVISKRFEEIDGRISQIADDAESMLYDLSNKLDEITERRDELLAARFGDDEAAIAAYEAALPEGDYRANQTGLFDEPSPDETVLDITDREAERALSVVGGSEQRARAILDMNVDGMDLPALDNALREFNSVVTQLTEAQTWARSMQDVANRKASDADTAIDVLHDETLVPAIDRLEQASESVADRIDEISERIEAPDGRMMFSLGDGFSQRRDPLPMDTASRMKRAEAMGFDTLLYHATTATEKFDAFELGRDTFNSDIMGPQATKRYAVFVSPSRDFVNEFADGEGSIMPLMGRLGKTLDATKGYTDALGEDFFARHGLNPDMFTTLDGKNAWQAFDGPDGEAFNAALRAEGYGSVKLIEDALPQDLTVDRISSSIAGIFLSRANGDKEAAARLVREEMAASPSAKKTYEAVLKQLSGDAPAKPAPAISYAILDPANLRSVNAAFDPRQEGSANLLYSLGDGFSQRRDLDSLGYYSQALEAARGLKQAKGAPEQMRAQLRAAGVKEAELQATKLDAFLDGKKSVTRDEIVQHLEANRVTLKGVVREKSKPAKIETRPAERDPSITEIMSNGELAGELYSDGSRIRVDLEDGRTRVFDDQAQALSWVAKVEVNQDATSYSSYSLDPQNPTYRETILHLPSETDGMSIAERFQKPDGSARLSKDFHSGHFDQPNIVGHTMTSMVLHEGQPVFLVDQIQSDWGQKLRDKGVRDEAKIADIKLSMEEDARDLGVQGEITAMKIADRLHDAHYDMKNRRLSQDQVDAVERLRLKLAELKTAEAATPGNPLVNTTDQWVDTTLRNVIRQAAEADAKFIAIPSGDTVLSYNPGDTDGMRGFYDGIVPKNLRKMLGKLDKDSPPPQRIDTVDSPTGKKGLGKGFTLFPLTDAVKQRVLSEGQPLFDLSGMKPFVQSPAYLAQLDAIRSEVDDILASILPQNVRVRVEDRLVFDIGGGRREVQGYYSPFDKMIAVSLGMGDPRRTAKHEAVHALRDLGLMTDGEFDILYRFAEQNGMRKAYNIDEIYGQAYTAKTRGNKNAAEAALREEVVAHLVSDFLGTSIDMGGSRKRFSDLPGGAAVDRILEVIARFIERMRNMLAGRGFLTVEDVFSNIELGKMARRTQRVELPGGFMVEGTPLFSIKAFHGTPHDFEPEPGAPAGRFRLDKVGTGEGAQAYGHGLYFAEREGVARSYRDKLKKTTVNGDSYTSKTPEGIAAQAKLFAGGDLYAARSYLQSNADFAGHTQDMRDLHKQALDLLEQRGFPEVQQDPGRLYEVRINAEPDEFLDWDKPLSQQSETVRNALTKKLSEKVDPNTFLASIIQRMGTSKSPGSVAYMRTEQAFGRKESASNALREAGIAGIRYLDQGSRDAGEGSYNYVVFDDSLIEIVAKDGEPVTLASAMPDIERMDEAANVVGACKA